MVKNSILALTAVTLVLCGELGTAETPAAPIPVQIAAGKTVFVSYTGGDRVFSGDAMGAPARFYDEFYFAVKSWGRYQIVPTPGEADLILEIGFREPVSLLQSCPSAAGCPDAQYTLSIVDPKTHITLWGFTEHAEYARLDGNKVKNHSSAQKQIVTDLKDLVTRAANLSGNASK